MRIEKRRLINPLVAASPDIAYSVHRRPIIALAKNSQFGHADLITSVAEHSWIAGVKCRVRDAPVATDKFHFVVASDKGFSWCHQWNDSNLEVNFPPLKKSPLKRLRAPPMIAFSTQLCLLIRPDPLLANANGETGRQAASQTLTVVTNRIRPEYDKKRKFKKESVQNLICHVFAIG